MTSDTRTSVMLVDDHSIMRDLLREALENTGEFHVVAQAADGQEALRMVEEAVPDVIVMDVIMPVMDGIEACREITELLPDTKVLMLTASNEKDAIVKSIAAGAMGYLQKYSDKEKLLSTLREVAEGEFRIPGERCQEVGPGSAKPVDRRRLRAVGESDGQGERDTEAVCRGDDLPGDRRDKEQQRIDGA